METVKTALLVLLTCLCVGLVLTIGCRKPPAPTMIDVPPLKGMVPEVLVKEVPGPERIVERIKFVTKEVEAKKDTVAAIVKHEQAPPDGPPPAPIPTRVRFNGEKNFARDGKKVVFGWTGDGICEVNIDGVWLELGSSEININESEVLGEPEVGAPPTQTERLNVLSLGAGIGTEGYAGKVELRRNLQWKTKVGKAIMPSEAGVELVVTGADTAVLGTLGWRF